MLLPSFESMLTCAVEPCKIIISFLLPRDLARLHSSSTRCRSFVGEKYYLVPKVQLNPMELNSSSVDGNESYEFSITSSPTGFSPNPTLDTPLMRMFNYRGLDEERLSRVYNIIRNAFNFWGTSEELLLSEIQRIMDTVFPNKEENIMFELHFDGQMVLCQTGRTFSVETTGGLKLRNLTFALNQFVEPDFVEVDNCDMFAKLHNPSTKIIWDWAQFLKRKAEFTGSYWDGYIVLDDCYYYMKGGYGSFKTEAPDGNDMVVMEYRCMSTHRCSF